MIQIDIDMPTDCLCCPILQSYKMWYCGISKKEVNDIFKRPNFCPLIEVKDGEQE